ncbi:MAG TPA: 5'/3'-nucleotidase SurE, partial [Gemmatimonadetes bacterium]|nr:5'/3'-nucleotidase SurE [Gemmatimonadota bacterium]
MTLNILCTNDDGYLSLGIGVLQRAATSLGDVVTVAPDREQSATSNSLTLHHPLRLRSSQDGVWVVDGTPTDCVIVAVNSLLSERPDLCVSGVNHGSNMGEDVLYSGTVAAAMEATVIGIPAVALSWCGDFPEELQTCEELVARVLGEILSRGPFPEDTLFNVNFPAIDPGEVQGIRITSLGR